ncbi:response regulator [bacterium]|nr:response regulator [bacterium]
MEHILLLEDDEDLRELVADLLQAEGYEVVGVASAQEAITVAQRSDFHLLLTDVRMAGEIDGVGALEAMKRRAGHLRSIVMTGYADLEVPVRAARLQADDYLTKPFEGQELLRCVRSVLDRDESPAAGLLSRLLASPGSLWERSRRWLHDRSWQSLQEVRQRLYQRYFLLIRSGRIGREEAYPTFQGLAQVEKALLHADPSRWGESIQRLRQLEAALLEATRPGAEISETSLAESFRRLYGRIRAGSVALEHFQRALTLWYSPEARKASLEAYTTFCRLWEEEAEEEDPFIGLQLGEVRLVRRLLGTSQARLYQISPSGGRVLCLPVIPENSGFLEAEVASGRVKHLGQSGGHHFLQYPLQPGRPLKGRMRPAGDTPAAAWKLLRPVFLEVVRLHGQGLVCGCFGARQVFLGDQGEVRIEAFGPERWRQLSASGSVDVFLAAPELIEQSSPDARSDQWVLARLMGEAVWGWLQPVDAFRLFAGDQSELPERMGAAWPVLRRLSAREPQQRFAELREAVLGLDAALEGVDHVDDGQQCGQGQKG